MTVYTPAAGTFSLAQELLRASIADSAAFRALVDADTQAKALERIHDEALPPPQDGRSYTLDELRALTPYAMLTTTSFHAGHTSTSDGFDFEASGAMRVRFVLEVDDAIAHNAGEVGRRLMNVVGQILDDILAVSGKPGYLAITQADMPEAWSQTHPDRIKTEGDTAMVDLEFSWGFVR